MTEYQEITRLLARYGEAVDRRDWDAFAALFTADATIDYTAMGGIAGDVATVTAWLAKTMAGFASTQHMMGLPVVDVDGDEAAVTVTCHNPLVLGDGSVLLCSLWYHERLVNTAQGWRIAALREERCFMKGL